MISKRAIMEMSGYEVIAEVEDKILVKDIDGEFYLYLGDKRIKAYKIFKGGYFYVIERDNKYFAIGADLNIQEEVDISGGWIITKSQNEYVLPAGF